ncbi:MAG: recombinase family protein [Lachnospiraceae bacterium]
MTKYVIAKYIRLSMEDEKYDSLSIPTQRKVIDRYIADMDIENAEILEFVDNGHTGTNFERPAVQKLLDMVREKQIDCIIAKDFSRFGRNAIETGYFIEMVFPIFSTRFIAISDNFDSANHVGDTGGLDVSFKFLLNEYYSKDMSIKSKSAKYLKFRSGEYQSSICPYGYRKGSSGRLEIDETAANTVRLIFESALLTKNAQDIVKLLYDRHIPTPGEYKKAQGKNYYDLSRSHGIWSRSTINRILADERYIGTYVIGKREVLEVGCTHMRLKNKEDWIRIPNHHPPIVSSELFSQVNAKLLHFKCNKHPRKYNLRGKVYCNCCRHAMNRAPRKEPAYLCRYTKVDESAKCYNLEISEAELESKIFAEIQNQAKNFLNAMENTDESISQEKLSHQCSRYNKQISEYSQTKLNLYEDYVLGEITSENYTTERDEIDKKIIMLNQSESATAIRLKQSKEIQKLSDNLLDISQKVIKSDKLTHSLVELLIDRVYVYPDKNFKIHWNKSTFGDN